LVFVLVIFKIARGPVILFLCQISSYFFLLSFILFRILFFNLFPFQFYLLSLSLLGIEFHDFFSNLPSIRLSYSHGLGHGFGRLA
jgi:hypothetical protein